jgi:outer membrane protein assembly factor BamB
MTEDELALVQPGSGEAVWTWQDATVGAFRELAVWRDRIFVTARNALVAMTFDGQVQWTTFIGALRATNHPWVEVTDGTHIVTTPWRGRRIVLDARSGEVVASPPVPVDPWPNRDKQQGKWNREVGIVGRTFVQWHSANGRLEVAGSDIFTGKSLWKRRPLVSPTVGLLIDDGVLRVVARSPGRMAAIDVSTGRLRDEHTDIWWDYGLNSVLIHLPNESIGSTEVDNGSGSTGTLLATCISSAA